ncbi:uncharacterized protein LAESUDRAFT_732434 [Laetiporus sulphureus 93-53]|uniref:Uncharacterized protein n=1 Tax=Laetiporus sulphureus 93-53 TaxID=1314785 RepID=A0A165B5G1_9APHY|nr:uncharacterized protein LAESUDRAFT_732434 [Laetiporus sulphureus 93-53]KZT00281.1 hypothetical protein LAESUDRAFT_732434 [Laetiporus sulphureus 93-53]
MGFKTVIAAATASLSRRNKGKRSASNRDTEMAADEERARRPLLTENIQPKQSSGSAAPVSTHSYGATQGSSNIHSSPEQYRRDSLLGRVPEEGDSVDEEVLDEAEEEEWDLRERGFYIGSYKRKVALYTLVPLSSLLVLLLLALLPPLLWKHLESDPPLYTRSAPFPLPEVLTGAALWSLSHQLRLPLFSLASYLLPSSLAHTLLFNIVHVLLSTVLRLAALPVLRVRHEMQYPLPTWHDAAFARVWWVALGWALADVAVGTAQGYEQLALYRDVMVPEERVRELLLGRASGASESAGRKSRASPGEVVALSPRPAQDGENGMQKPANGHSESVEDALRLAVDKDLEELVRLKDREELEEIYGIAPIDIPVFVSSLQRIDSLVLSLGLTLILAWAYLCSPLAFSDIGLPPIYSHRAFAITFPLIYILLLFLALLHSPLVLPRIGVHTTAYIGLLLGLGSVFAGLGLWGALS